MGRHGGSAVRAAFALVAMLGLLVGCAGAGALGGGGGTQLTIAIVSNPQMEDAIALSKQFREENPDIKLNFVSLPENEARAKITTSVATGGGEYDVTMISNYETQMWAENGWLTNLQPFIDETSGYDAEDFIPSLRESLSYKGDMYSVPFYGESSFLTYRKDLFEKAGVTMPANPTWQEVAELAKKLDGVEKGVSGICLRGIPGWGEVLAPLDTVINAFGGRWFDENWDPQLTSPEVKQAVQFYVDTIEESGQSGAAASNFGDCLNRYSQGQAAMWYDATSMVSTTEDPKASKVAGKNGYAPAPVTESTKDGATGWLYTWSLGIPKTTENKDAAWKFVSWMTDKQYIKTVGDELGWARVPPGSRLSTYDIPEVEKASSAYAQPTLRALRSADETKPTVQPVPYQGIQFLRIPEFQDLGTRTSQQISAAIAGNITVDEALEQSQGYAESVGKTYRK